MLKNISLVCCTHSWNIFQHLRSNKFEIFMLWNAISSVLRRQFMSKMFAIIDCHFYAYYYFHGLLLKYLILFYILDIIFSKCTLVLFWVYKYHKNSFENIRCQNWDFPILIAYWSWFKIFKQMARLGWEHSLNLLQLNFVVSGSKKQGCREPIRTVFRQLFDHNADGLVDETELADLYEAEPCMKQFFKTCSKGKETFTEPEFCSCFKSVGRSQVHIVFLQ